MLLLVLKLLRCPLSTTAGPSLETVPAEGEKQEETPIQLALKSLNPIELPQ